MSINTDQTITNFLLETFKRSTGSYNNNKSILKRFFNYINKPVDKITVFDVIDYFDNSLDKQPIKITTKNTRRYTLKAFFNHIRKQHLQEGLLYTNPVPDRDIYKFTQQSSDIARQSTKILPILNKEQLKQILDYWAPIPFHENHIRNYTMFLLDMCTGARISEIRTLRLKDINIAERYFETGFIKDARKTTSRTEESLLFFFPVQILPALEQYIKKRHMNSEFLFYSPRNKNKPVSHELGQSIAKFTSKKVGFKFTWHYFRKTIITNRIKLGCSEGLSEGLANHKGKSVEWESYIELNIPEKRELYDKYFPYTDFI